MRDEIPSLLKTRLAEIANPNVVRTDIVTPTREGWAIIFCGVLLVVLTTLWTSVRLWSTRLRGKWFLWEDGLSLMAIILFWGLVATNTVAVVFGGMGHHFDELQQWHIIRLLKATYARQFLYTTSLGFIKVSVILTFIRLFIVRRFRVAAYCVIGFSIIWMAMTVFIALFICPSIEMNWSQKESNDQCGNYPVVFSAAAVIDLLNELAILALPLHSLCNLKTDRRYKSIIGYILGAGFITTLLAVLRLYTILQVDYSDASYTAATTTVYDAVETGIAIIMSNSLLLRPAFDQVHAYCHRPSLTQAQTWQGNDSKLSLSTIGAGDRMASAKSGKAMQRWALGEELELGNVGAHRFRRETDVSVGKRPSFDSSSFLGDDGSMLGIVVTSETIVTRDDGEL
ncbi:hypothetical protein F5Y15DRAFT_428148 [Xylariaceae sp. FL0016]|nr:hypothetical protein F5Y15DRAFT_428148 [Xylariaceae sp. FL0016]